MIGSPAPGARFVDPAVLARVGNLEFVARSIDTDRGHLTEVRHVSSYHPAFDTEDGMSGQ